MDNVNLYNSSSSETNEPNGVKMFWYNLNRRQRNVFIAGSIVVAILLVVGFVVSMDLIKKNAGDEIADTASEGVDENPVDEVSDDYVDPATITPIEGGDPDDIDTYLPHITSREITPELTEHGILDVKYDIEIDKDSEVITIRVYDMNDTEARAEAEEYLAKIPSEVLEGYRIETKTFYDND